MKIRLGHFLSCLACIYLVGGQWAVLQSVAMAGMLVDYARIYGPSQGLVMTFDGNNPCEMCHTIQAEKKKAETQDSPIEKLSKGGKKAEFLLFASMDVVPPAPSSLESWPVLMVLSGACGETPPTPPPRSA